MAEEIIIFYYLWIFFVIILSFFFAAMIYRSTRRATKAWFYLVMYIALNSFLPLISLERNAFPGSDALTRGIHGLISLFTGALILIAASIFLKDFGIKTKLSPRVMIYLYGSFFLLNILLGFMNHVSFALFSGISYYVLSFALLLAGASFLRIFFLTKEAHWCALSISVLLEGISLFGLAYIQGCCNLLSSLPQCLNIAGTSVTPFPQLCSPSIVFNYLPLVWASYIAWFMGLVAYFLVYRFWKKTTSS